MVVPYNFSLEDSDGAWISPSGNIIKTYNTHEGFAKNYCLGNNYEYLCKIKYKLSENKFNRWRLQSNFFGNREDINEFMGSRLTIEELELLKKWIKEFQYCGHVYSDFLLSYLQFSKAQIITEKTITTTESSPYIKFWNYYLMNWDIDQIPRICYNSFNDRFDILDGSFFENKDNEYAKKELDEIKLKVKKSERPNYFR